MRMARKGSSHVWAYAMTSDRISDRDQASAVEVGKTVARARFTFQRDFDDRFRVERPTFETNGVVGFGGFARRRRFDVSDRRSEFR
jgi:hypothetical protein